jgi:hypothetical protein
MAAHRWYSLSLPIRRKLSAGLVLCTYLTAVIGVPIPASMFKENGQNAPCGCGSVEQSQGSCCCSLNGTGTPGCCGRPIAPQPVVIAEPVAPPQRACCAKRHAAPHETLANAKPALTPGARLNETSGFRWVMGLSAQRCMGIYSMWVNCASALVPPADVTCTITLVPLGWVASPSDAAIRLPNLPPEPPPRNLSA